MNASRQGHEEEFGGAVDLEPLPGYDVRRLQLIAVAVFLQETEVHGSKPVQRAALRTVADAPGIDRRNLARTIGLDTWPIPAIANALVGLATDWVAPLARVRTNGNALWTESKKVSRR